MKDANRSTRLKPSTKQQKARVTNAPTGKREGDARGDDRQLHENQAELGIGPNHETPAMENKKRGTFP